MRYEFLVETYETERIKVVSVWSEFRDHDLPAGHDSPPAPSLDETGYHPQRA